MEFRPDSWRVISPNFCGTHTVDKEVADYWIDRSQAYPVYKLPDLPNVRGVSVDAESPRRSAVLVTFERELTTDELESLHELLCAVRNK